MHEAMGQTSRWQRYTADLLYILASGNRIDPDRTPRFSEIVKEIYRNPFDKPVKQPYTAEEIKAYIVGRLEELLINGSAQTGSEN